MSKSPRELSLRLNTSQSTINHNLKKMVKVSDVSVCVHRVLCVAYWPLTETSIKNAPV